MGIYIGDIQMLSALIRFKESSPFCNGTLAKSKQYEAGSATQEAKVGAGMLWIIKSWGRAKLGIKGEGEDTMIC